MWFKFPEGVTTISVEQQTFTVEARDKDGREYFRAPDHFAPRILSLPRFESVANPPEGAPEDLPKADPERDASIATLANQIESLKLELSHVQARLAETSAERDDLKSKVFNLEAELNDLRSGGDQAEAGIEVVEPPKSKK